MSKSFPAPEFVAGLFAKMNIRPMRAGCMAVDAEMNFCGCGLTVLAIENGFKVHDLMTCVVTGMPAGTERSNLYKFCFDMYGKEFCKGFMSGFDGQGFMSGFDGHPDAGYNSNPEFDAGHSAGCKVASLVNPVYGFDLV